MNRKQLAAWAIIARVSSFILPDRGRGYSRWSRPGLAGDVIVSDGWKMFRVDLAFVMDVLEGADGADHIDLTTTEGDFEIAQIGQSLFDLGSGWPLRLSGNIADVDHKDFVAEVTDDPG